MCAHAMEETMDDVGGETSVYKVSGFSLVITRKSSKVWAEYIIVFSMLVVTATFSSCLSLFSGRAGLALEIYQLNTLKHFQKALVCQNEALLLVPPSVPSSCLYWSVTTPLMGQEE